MSRRQENRRYCECCDAMVPVRQLSARLFETVCGHWLIAWATHELPPVFEVPV